MAADRPQAAGIEALQRAKLSQPQRLLRLSERFLGRPYLLSPLGEGPGHRRDPDPRFRLDRFDCVTLTETLMALSWTPSLAQANRLLQHIRYRDGRIGYGSRNHIMMAQWIPNNIRNGMLRDISNELGHDKRHHAALRLAKKDYLGQAGRQLGLTEKERPRGSFRIGLVPLALALDKLEKLPALSILSTVRQRDKHKPYRISHVALLLRKGKGWVVRHADARSQRVIEESFAGFVGRAKKQRSWPVVGFNLLAIAPAWSPNKAASRAQRSGNDNVRHR